MQGTATPFGTINHFATAPGYAGHWGQTNIPGAHHVAPVGQFGYGAQPINPAPFCNPFFGGAPIGFVPPIQNPFLGGLPCPIPGVPGVPGVPGFGGAFGPFAPNAAWMNPINYGLGLNNPLCGGLTNPFQAFTPGWATGFNATQPFGACVPGCSPMTQVNPFATSPIQSPWLNPVNPFFGFGPFQTGLHGLNAMGALPWMNPSYPINTIGTMNPYTYGASNSVIPQNCVGGMCSPLGGLFPIPGGVNPFSPINTINPINPIAGFNPFAFAQNLINPGAIGGAYPYNYNCNWLPGYNAFTPTSLGLNAWSPTGVLPYTFPNFSTGGVNPGYFPGAPLTTTGFPFGWQNPYFSPVPFINGHFGPHSYPFPTDRDGVTVTTSISPNGVMGGPSPLVHREAA